MSRDRRRHALTGGDLPGRMRDYNASMSRHRLTRFALNGLAILFLVAAVCTAPAQAVAQALHEAIDSRAPASLATDSHAAMAMTAGMPCGDMPSNAGDAHSYGCAHNGCDLSVCLGTACLPELPRLIAAVPATVLRPQWQAAMPPSRQIDTPLRPPIG